MSTTAERIGEAIRRIDPIAMNSDSFWGTFVDDVAIGDFATEDVVGSRSGGGGPTVS
jgi:hypothetical protein